MNLQDGIIRRYRLECNISVPAIASEFARLGQLVYHGDSTFLLLHAANDADLVTELAVGFSDGMNVKAGRLRLCGKCLLARLSLR